MAIDGFVDYKRREYCKDVECPVQMIMNKKKEGTPEHDELREICKNKCIHTTYEFHHWLIENDFLVVKPDVK